MPTKRLIDAIYRDQEPHDQDLWTAEDVGL